MKCSGFREYSYWCLDLPCKYSDCLEATVGRKFKPTHPNRTHGETLGLQEGKPRCLDNAQILPDHPFELQLQSDATAWGGGRERTVGARSERQSGWGLSSCRIRWAIVRTLASFLTDEVMERFWVDDGHDLKSLLGSQGLFCEELAQGKREGTGRQLGSYSNNSRQSLTDSEEKEEGYGDNKKWPSSGNV